MLAGVHQDALSQYLIAGEYLRAGSDVLWLAGALEGQCAASLVLNRNEKVTDRNSLILPTKCAVNSVNLTMNGLGNDVDETKFRNPQPLGEEEIVERLSEALRLYNRVSTCLQLHVRVVHIYMEDIQGTCTLCRDAGESTCARQETEYTVSCGVEFFVLK